jgi:hypothetical protein
VRNRLLTPLLLLLCATAALAGTSAEVTVGAAAVVPPPHLRSGVSVASDGDGYFAVWEDSRVPYQRSIVGTRVSAAGEVRDGNGLILGEGQEPAVVWDGSAYLVVWKVGRQPSPGLLVSSIWTARVTPEGRLASAAGMVRETADYYAPLALAVNGAVSVVGYRSGGAVHAMVLDRDGSVLHDHGLGTSSGTQRDVTVAAGGSGFLVAWSMVAGGTTIVEASTLDASGAPASPEARTISEGFDPRAAGSSDGYVLVTRNGLYTGTWSGRGVTADLESITPPCTISGDPLLEQPTLLARDGHYDFIAWKRQSPPGFGPPAIVGGRLDRAGCPAPSPRVLHPIVAEHTDATPALATNGRDLFVAWTQSRRNAGRYDIAGRMYDDDFGAKTDTLILARSGNSQRDVQIARGAASHLVVWREDDYRFRAARVTPDGRTIDGRGILLGGATAAAPRVAFDGRAYMVAWGDNDGLALCWIDEATGAVTAAQRLDEPNTGQIALAATPEAVYLAWIGATARVRLARIAADTQFLDVTPADQKESSGPLLSWNGSSLLVVWMENETVRGQRFPDKVWAARVTPALTLLDPAPLLVDDFHTIDHAAVASDGTDWLVVSSGGGGFEGSVRARRVLHDGRLDGTAPAQLTAGFWPAVTWDGVRYAIAWHDRSAVRVGSVDRAGLTGIMRVASSDASTGVPAIAPADGSGVAVAYTRVSWAPEHAGAVRAFLRFLNTSGPRKPRAVR